MLNNYLYDDMSHTLCAKLAQKIDIPKDIISKI